MVHAARKEKFIPLRSLLTVFIFRHIENDNDVRHRKTRSSFGSHPCYLTQTFSIAGFYYVSDMKSPQLYKYFSRTILTGDIYH